MPNFILYGVDNHPSLMDKWIETEFNLDNIELAEKEAEKIIPKKI